MHQRHKTHHLQNFRWFKYMGRTPLHVGVSLWGPRLGMRPYQI